MHHPPELDWPLFDDTHRDFKSRLDDWCHTHLAHAHHDETRDAVDAECVRLVRLLGSGGWLRHAVAGTAHGGGRRAQRRRDTSLSGEPA